MSIKLLTFKDRKTGKRSCFCPMTVASIVEHYQVDGVIIVYSLGDNSEDGGVHITYSYDEAQKRWQEAINS